MTYPMNDGGSETNRLYAWVATDGNGIEGVVSIPTGPQGEHAMPLVCTNRQLANDMLPGVLQVAMARRATVRLVEYLRGEELDSVEPLPVWRKDQSSE